MTPLNDWERACLHYWRLMRDAAELGRIPPAETWFLACGAVGRDPCEVPPPPPAGWLRCPLCGVSKQYACPPTSDTECCLEWELHEGWRVEWMDVRRCWEPATITCLREMGWPGASGFDPTAPAAIQPDSCASDGSGSEATLEALDESRARASATRKRKAKSRTKAKRDDGRRLL